jgi:pantetheine-phosphate adenylyltransferase
MSKKIAIYPGTFDPVTNGHLDILARASRVFDHIVVAFAEKTSKSTLFTLNERTDLFRAAMKGRKYSCPISIESFQGLLIKFAQKRGAGTLVRGLRAVSDFEYEFQMALMNRSLSPKIETVFLMPDEKFVYLSSSIVKEVARLHGNLGPLLPLPVRAALIKKFQ